MANLENAIPALRIYRDKIVNVSLVVGTLLGILTFAITQVDGDIRPFPFPLIDQLLILVLVIFSVFRKRINAEIKTVGLMFVVYCLAVTDLFQFGLMSDNALLLPLVPVFSILIFNVRITIGVSAFLVISYSLAAYLLVTETVAINYNLQSYLVAAEWLERLLILGIVTVIVVITIYNFSKDSTKFMVELANKSQEIEDREANLKSLFESTNNIIGLYDTEKRLIEFNQAFADYAKYTDGIDLEIGMVVIDHLQNKEVAEVFRSFQNRALNGEKFSEVVEYPMDGDLFYFQLSYNPILKNDKVEGFSMFVSDITELKNSQRELEKYSERLEQLVNDRTEKLNLTNVELKKSNDELSHTLQDLKNTQNQLVESEKMASLGILAAGVGHEINNPLNFIQGGIQVLEREIVKKEVNREKINTYFQVIKEGVRRCAAITDSLSNYSRHGRSLKEQCNVNAILDNCLLILGSKLKSNIEIVKEYVDDPMILGNEGKLHQVFLNILTNAIQAIKAKGQVRIATSLEGEVLSIIIQDNGSGIKEEDLNKISDPFFTTKAPGEGTGLGLSIAYNIIREHSGFIDCSSQFGEGTIFTIKIPKNQSGELIDEKNNATVR